MSEWCEKSLADVCSTIRAGGTPTSDRPDFYGGDIPFVTIEDITRAGRLIESTARSLTTAGLNSSAAWVVAPGHILFSMYATLGKVVVNAVPAATNQAILALKPDASRLDLELLFYVLQFMEPQVRRLSAQTTQANLSAQVVRRIRIGYPRELPQQRRIAEILGRVDEVIEQTEALIAKQQQVKAGLMHDLFTRGLTRDGQLRPSRAEAPELYHETPLGWLPREWGWATIEELLAKTFTPMRSGPFGSALLKEELVESGVPFLGIDNVLTERFEPTYRRFVSRHKFARLIRYSVFPGDVIITIMGTVGRCCVIPDSVQEALSSKHLWTMTFDRDKVLPELVCWQLNHAPWVKRWFARHAQGAVMDAIQSSTLRGLTLPLPFVDEQRLIALRYLSANKALAAETAHLAKLRQLKQGLMKALLTPPA